MADRRQSIMRAVGLALCVAVLAAWIWMEKRPVERVAPAAGQAIAIDKAPRVQDARKAALDHLIEQGLVRRFERKGADAVQVSLRPTFYTLDEDTRRKHLRVVYEYYFDGSSITDTVLLRDARHGNNVGRYNPYSGGLTMYK